MIDGNTAFFLLPGNRTNRADVHALRLFALTAGIRGIVEIAIQATTWANPVVAKEIIAMDFDTGEECPYRAIVEVGTRDFTAVATRASRTLGHQHPFGCIYQPYCAAINIFLFATQKWQ